MLPIRDSRVLVTGAGGFIGFHLTRRLLAEGAEVHIIHLESEESVRLEQIKGQVHSHVADLRDLEALVRIVRDIRPQKIFHLAAEVNADRSPELLPQMMAVNFQGTVNILSALEKVPYDCFVNTGTCEEYGVNPAPFVETQRERPVSPYSFSKVAATHYCQMLNRTEGWPIITLRPFLTYGPYQTGSMLIPALIRHCLGNDELPMTEGEQTREFNYVSDIVQGYLTASTTEAAVGEVINLGNGIEYKIKNVVEMVIKACGSKTKPQLGTIPYRTGEAMRFYCSARKARDLLDWQSEVSLEEGLANTVEWNKGREG